MIKCNLQGVRGIPDLLIIRKGVFMFIELKTPKGKLTVAQEWWHARLREHDVYVSVARSLEEVQRAFYEAGL